MTRKKTNAGRPRIVTEKVLQKLKDGFLQGFSNREACIYAEIKETTFYQYCQENPDYLQKKKEWQENVKMRAKANISRDIENGDNATSRWYLERKAKDEFGTRTEITGKDGNELSTVVVIKDDIERN